MIDQLSQGTPSENKESLSVDGLKFGGFFFMPHPGQQPFGLISADYSEFDSSMTYDEINNHVCERFRKSMREYCQRKGEKYLPLFDDNSRIIILWRNVPDSTNGKVVFDKTLEMLCEYKGFAGEIYIRSIQDIADIGIEHLIHMITVLFKNARRYVFFDNDFFSAEIDTLTGANLEQVVKEETAKGNIIKATVAEVYSKFGSQIMRGEVVSELDCLIQRPEPIPINRFLEVYWEWQKAEVAVDVCKKELDITHRTFYKYSQMYEATPYYCEHLKIYRSEIEQIAKRGPLPQKEEYLRDMYALDLGQITNSDVCKKYGLASEIDIKRVKIALTERRRKAR